MSAFLPIFLFLLAASLGVLLLIERVASRYFPGRVPFWRRIWIPVPMLIFLKANDMDVCFARETFTLRHATHPITDLVILGGFLAVAVLPLLIARGTAGARRSLSSFGFSCLVWGLYGLWFLVPFMLLMFSTGLAWRWLIEAD